MDQTPGVGRGQTLRNLSADAQHFGQRQPAPGPLQPVFEGLATEQLHGQERDAAVLSHLIDGDDVLVVDGGGQPGLAQKSPVVLGAGRQGRPHDFQGHQAPEVGVLRLEDDAHGAGPQDLQDAVGAKPAHLVRALRRRQERVVRGRGQIEGIGKGGRRVLRRGGRMDGLLAGAAHSTRAPGRGGAHDLTARRTRPGSAGHALVHPERGATVRAREGNHVTVGIEEPVDHTTPGRRPASGRRGLVKLV